MMLILSAGMQKSGTAYLYNIINDLLISSGNADARAIKKKYGLEKIMKWHNNIVDPLRPWHWVKLLKVGAKEKPFVVKTHSGPTVLIKLLLFIGYIKVIYIYRDPRDVLISAVDHGKKIISEGQNHTFAEMIDFENAFVKIKSWVKSWKQYAKNRKVLLVRYEDLINQPIMVVDQIANYLNIKIQPDDVKEILLKFDKNNKSAELKGLHFNQAITGRYVNELSATQLELFKKEMGLEIQEMGYEL